MTERQKVISCRSGLLTYGLRKRMDFGDRARHSLGASVAD